MVALWEGSEQKRMMVAAALRERDAAALAAVLVLLFMGVGFWGGPAAEPPGTVVEGRGKGSGLAGNAGRWARRLNRRARWSRDGGGPGEDWRAALTAGSGCGVVAVHEVLDVGEAVADFDSYAEGDDVLFLLPSPECGVADSEELAGFFGGDVGVGLGVLQAFGFLLFAGFDFVHECVHEFFER